MTRVQFGWLVRSIHSWAANLMISYRLRAHVQRVVPRAYRKPREMTWITGMLLLFLAMGFGFSGYLLPVEYAGIFRHQGRNGNYRPGTIHRTRPEGLPARRRRSDGRHADSLLRVSRRAVCPGLTTLLLLIHIALVQYFGMSVPPAVEARLEGLAR